MPEQRITTLGYALLGLLHQKPASGYALRKIFAATSMKTYSGSPGAIYPALRQLEKLGLIRGKVEESAGVRQRQVFQLTPFGVFELKEWIARPVTREDVVRGAQEIMLRFAFSEMAVGTAAAVELLRSLEEVLKKYLMSLILELKAMPEAMPTSGRLAFQCGIRGNQALLEWTRYALETYAQQQSPNTPNEYGY